jgi:hypothetical protein
LKHLQPSVVNTLHSGAGPLTVILLASFGTELLRGWQSEHAAFART